MQREQRRCPLCGNIVCRHMEIDDAGKRFAEIVSNIRMSNDWDDIKNSWIAVKLEDGSCDGTVYDTRAEAIKFNTNKANKYFYVALRNAIHGLTAKEATLMLAMVRTQAARGRYHPEDQPDPIMPLSRETFNDELVSTKQGVPWIIPGIGNILDRIDL